MVPKFGYLKVKRKKKVRSIDTIIFWMRIYVNPLFLGIFIILEIISLRFLWFLLCVIGFILTFSNVFGYYKCSGKQKRKFKVF